MSFFSITFTIVWRKGFSVGSSAGSNRDTIQRVESNIRMVQFANRGYTGDENVAECGFIDYVPTMNYLIKPMEERFVNEEKIIVRIEII